MVRLENVLKISLQDVLKMSWRYLEDVFKTSWRCLEDIWPRRIYWSWPRHLEDVRLRRTYSSWSRRLQDIFWRRRRKTSLSRRMFAGLFISQFFELIKILICLFLFKNKFTTKKCLCHIYVYTTALTWTVHLTCLRICWSFS